MLIKFKLYKAFTLAEVLITLGIIGIVAGMTIPILMTKIQNMQFKEAAKTAYSKASQAVQQMKIDQGGTLSYYYANVNKFKPVFMQYFKISQDCNWNDCVPNTAIVGGVSAIYTSLSGDPTATWIMGNGQFITTDGMFWGIANDGTNICITVDVNGYGQKPNAYGRDTFVFQVLNDVVVPMGAPGTWFPIGNSYCRSSAHVSGNNGFHCMYYVLQGIDY